MVAEKSPDAVAETPRGARHSLGYYAGIAAALFALAFILTALWAMRRNADDTPSLSNGSPVERRAGANTARTAATQAQPAAAEPATASPSADAKDERALLRSQLNDWVAATNARDLERQMAFYAPRLEAFYLQRNYSRQSVRAEKARLIAQVDAVEVRVGEPETIISSDRRAAFMRFSKSWSFRGAQASSGEVIQELRWTLTEAGWKITSERDVQVIR